MSWSFYDAATGIFSGRVFSGSAKLLALNTPPGHGAIEGQFDRRTQRVNIDTGEVAAYQRPQAEIDAENIALRDVAARLAIEALERDQQPRAVREALLALLPDGTEKARLRAIEDDITAHRAELRP